MVIRGHPIARLAQAYDALQAALASIEPEPDRLVARNAVRDALDKGGQTLEQRRSSIIADTFSIEETVHEGPAFTVLKLRHRDLGTAYALKTVRDDRQSDPLLRAMILREGHLMLGFRHSALQAASAVLRLPDGRPGILMAFLEGTTLASSLESGPLPIPAVARLALRLLDALEALHGAGHLHLDLTPANILLPAGKVGDAVLTDFGLSLSEGESHSAHGLVAAASFHFASPEQNAGDTCLDARSDLFSFGCIVKSCIDDRSRDALHAWLAQLTSPDPDSRPKSVSEARQSFLQAAALLQPVTAS